VTIALTAAEAEAIARANAALSWINAGTFPWAFAKSAEIHMYAAGLRGSMDDYSDLTAGRTHPATVFPDLDSGQDNAMEIALDKVTQDIRDWTGALVSLAREAEDAAYALGEVA